MTDLPGSVSPGDLVAGRYRVEELLGEGGFGNVYRAVQLNLDRPVALKMLHPELLLSDRGLDRFRREARLAQSLEHPNTVRLYDFGQTEAGLPYMAMELLRGRPLDRALDEDGPMAPARVARVASQVLKALMEAHERGIVHRDVKPQNVFLVDFQGEPDFVKMLDFGVAKPLRGAAAAPVTLDGEIVGTPSYMAPEQVRGEEVGPPADLYALGLVMAELASGETVYGRGSALQICAEQLSDEQAPVPEEVLGSPLGEVIARATAKPLEARYRSAAEMLEDIQTATSRAASEPAWHRASKPPPRSGSPGLAFSPTQLTPPGRLPTGPSGTGRGAGPRSEGEGAPAHESAGRAGEHGGGRGARAWASAGAAGPEGHPAEAARGAPTGPEHRGRPPGGGMSSATMVFVAVTFALVLALAVAMVTGAAMCVGCARGCRASPRVEPSGLASPPPPAAAPLATPADGPARLGPSAEDAEPSGPAR